MLYHIVIIIIFAVLAYAVVVLFRKFTIIQKRRKERQLKESEFMNELVSGGDLKPFKIKGEIVRVQTDGVGVKFKIDSQVQESALKSFMNNIQISE